MTMTPDSKLTAVTNLDQLRSGVILSVGPSANVQFNPPILFRLIRVMEEWTRLTYEGWCWLSGYELDHYGNALIQRHIFVQIRGLHVAHTSTTTIPKEPNG